MTMMSVIARGVGVDFFCSCGIITNVEVFPLRCSFQLLILELTPFVRPAARGQARGSAI